MSLVQSFRWVMQMNTILLSINPEHVENIINGTKKYEFRRVKCKRKVDKILIYATSPVKMIVGEAAVTDVIEDSIEQVWKLTSQFSGISEAFFNDYYIGKQQAVAYKLGEITSFSKPFSLDEIGVKSAPQSFVYMSDSMMGKVTNG